MMLPVMWEEIYFHPLIDETFLCFYSNLDVNPLLFSMPCGVRLAKIYIY